MRLREVLDRPGLGLDLLSGSDTDLDRPVRRVYTTDLLDPRRYLSGGELVLTGLMWRRGPADSEAFAANLADLGVSAVGAGEAALGRVPVDLVDACRRHGLVLFRIPVEVSFQVISDEVGRSAWWEHTGDLASSLGRHRELVTAMARGAGLADLFPVIARDLGVTCWVRSATGRIIAGTDPLPAAIAERLARYALTAHDLPRTSTVDGRRFRLLAVPGRPAHRFATWHLVCEEEDAQPAAQADELLNLVALERARLDEIRGVERRPAGRLVRLLASGAEPSERSELRATLHACGLSPEADFVVVTARLYDRPGGTVEAGTTAHLLEELLRPLTTRAAVGETADGSTAVVTVEPGGAAGVAEALRVAAAALGPCMGAHRLAIGINDRAVRLSGLPAAAEHARHARDAAGRAGAPAEVVCSADLASHLLLLAGVDPASRTSFQSRLLGPLEDYDRTHQSDLVRTLRTFLECSGSWNRCAEILHVHVNTLRYRLTRIERLTGRDLSRFEDRVDFFLALRLSAL